MDEKLITLAIHSKEKAEILRNILEKNGIKVSIEKVEDLSSENRNLDGFYVKISNNSLSKALFVIERHHLFFSYKDENISRVDDGKRRILVAVDFSDYSMKACQTAFNIAKEINAKVKILHVYQIIYFPSQVPFSEQLKDKTDVGLLDKVRGQMLELCSEIEQKIQEKEWPSVNFSYSLREGRAEEEIQSFISEYKPALLVLGTKGIHNNTSSILGNVTADIIEMVNVPVLAVPSDFQIDTITKVGHIVFFTNFQTRDFSSFNTLLEILNQYHNIKITLLHVAEGDEEREESQIKLIGKSEYFQRLYPNTNILYKLIDAPDVSQAINDFLKQNKVNLLSLNTRKRNLFGRIFSPSMSRKILEESNKALLVLRS
ncbi:MAG: universal stress protein [Prevotella sp.]|jgi:nucleotide-binding universal stress UspA family protein|nr:universal stress protein [Prevotella sp.]